LQQVRHPGARVRERPQEAIKGRFLATLLLASQEGGRPLQDAAWILLGGAITTVVDAYATHPSGRGYSTV